VGHRVFEEADLGDTKTALATEPVDKEKRKLFRELPLLAG